MFADTIKILKTVKLTLNISYDLAGYKFLIRMILRNISVLSTFLLIP